MQGARQIGALAPRAKKQWQANASSEERCLQLLPDSEPQSLDELMINPRYVQALELAG